MGRFAENALRIFEAADDIGTAGEAAAMTILITPGASLRIISDTDWPLESLRADYGASMAYRVTRQDAKVRLEGCADHYTCQLDAPSPVSLQALVSAIPQYTLA
ncbi:MAG: hypothetical protein ABI823_05545 [Bryobacteraceae bacterium]